MSPWVWLLIAVGLLVVEVTNLALFALFGAVGAIAAALASAAGGGIVAQSVTFAAVSIGGATLLRHPFVRAMHRHSAPALRTGVAALVGEHATVVSAVHGHDRPGSVHARGEDWPAVTYDERTYEAGEVVHVIEIEQTRLVVTEP